MCCWSKSTSFWHAGETIPPDGFGHPGGSLLFLKLVRWCLAGDEKIDATVSGSIDKLAVVHMEVGRLYGPYQALRPFSALEGLFI